MTAGGLHGGAGVIAGGLHGGTGVTPGGCMTEQG